MKSPYAKAIVGLIGAVSAWGMTALINNGIDGSEWAGLGVALTTALGVYTVPNTKPTE